MKYVNLIIEYQIKEIDQVNVRIIPEMIRYLARSRRLLKKMASDHYGIIQMISTTIWKKS